MDIEKVRLKGKVPLKAPAPAHKEPVVTALPAWHSRGEVLEAVRNHQVLRKISSLQAMKSLKSKHELDI